MIDSPKEEHPKAVLEISVTQSKKRKKKSVDATVCSDEVTKKKKKRRVNLVFISRSSNLFVRIVQK